MKHRLKSLIIVVAALCLLTGQALFAMDSVDNDLSELMAEIQDATNKGDSPATSPCISPVSSRPASPSQEQPILNEQAFAGALSNKPTLRKTQSFSSLCAFDRESDLCSKIAAAKNTSKKD